jgi:hypothetical protein
MLKYSHPVLAMVLDYWPITIFAPAVLLLIATLALITRWWDRRDQAAQERARPVPAATGAVVAWPTARVRSNLTPASPRPGHYGAAHNARAAS